MGQPRREWFSSYSRTIKVASGIVGQRLQSLLDMIERIPCLKFSSGRKYADGGEMIQRNTAG